MHALRWTLPSRMGFELMKVNRAIREAIKQEKSAHEIESIAEEGGMLTENLCS